MINTYHCLCSLCKVVKENYIEEVQQARLANVALNMDVQVGLTDTLLVKIILFLKK
jgi:ABC-type thiamine transport system substrate-binding protein